MSAPTLYWRYLIPGQCPPRGVRLSASARGDVTGSLFLPCFPIPITTATAATAAATAAAADLEATTAGEAANAPAAEPPPPPWTWRRHHGRPAYVRVGGGDWRGDGWGGHNKEGGVGEGKSEDGRGRAPSISLEHLLREITV